jgi:hypothetical protein
MEVRYNHYEVFFDVYGKKMKTTVLAANEQDAKQKVLQKVKFDKVEKKKDNFNGAMDAIYDLLK